MARVSAQVKKAVITAVSEIPPELRGKCALCNVTLTHIVKSIEAKTGAGTATVCKELAVALNEDAAPQDKVSPKALQNRVRREEGEDVKIPNRDNNTPPTDQTWTCTECGGTFPLGQGKCNCPGQGEEDLHTGPSKAVRDAFGPQGLEKDALALILKEAKRGCSKKCHPDVNPNGAELMAVVNRMLDEIKNHYGMEG